MFTARYGLDVPTTQMTALLKAAKCRFSLTAQTPIRLLASRFGM